MSTYVAKTEDEINKIALGIKAGTCYGTWHAETARLSFSIVQLFITQEILDTWKMANIVHFYEFVDKAGPMAVNGYPSFMSFNLIDASDWKRVVDKLKALEAAMEPAP